MVNEESKSKEQRGLVILSALINFADLLDAQGVLISNTPEPRAAELRGQLVKDFLAAHSEGENYFMQAEQIAEILGKPFEDVGASAITPKGSEQ